MIHTLKADGIGLEFDLRRVLSDVYLQCETGKVTGLLGRNGEGKSCLMNIISGNLNASSKSIRIDDQAVIKTHGKPNLILHLPQFNFIPKALRVKTVLDDFGLNFGDLINWFPEFKLNLKVGQLSGGQCRTLEIYVIAQKQSLFAMLDEPFTHLNPIQIEKVKEFLTTRKAYKGFLITDHMYQHVIDMSDTLYLLKNGKVHPINNIRELDDLGYVRLQH